MFGAGYYEDDGTMGASGLGRLGAGGASRRFDTMYRCYPIVMMSGPERESANHGGKIFLPASALDKLTRLHISYPMMFELINGEKDKMTHAGVLEFIAEEGRAYLPFWLMQGLQLEPGDMLQVKSTDLPSGSFIKLQAQSTSFLDISDPKAVLERVFRNYSCLTKGDVFAFSYNDQIFEMAVLETKPSIAKNGAIVVLETDLEVDFAPPVGYEEPKRPSGTSTPRSGVSGGVHSGGMLHNQGTMAQAINYSSIAPESTTAAAGARAVSSNFLLGGNKLNAKKGSKAPTPKPSTPVAGASTNPPLVIRRTNGPQPLRLAPGKLFFGYEIKPVRKTGEKETDEKMPKFQGQGQTLRGGTKRKDGDTSGRGTPSNEANAGGETKRPSGGRTLRDSSR